MTIAEQIIQIAKTLPDAAYDGWFKAQVQQAIDDARPGIPADSARELFAARRAALRQQTQAKR